MFECARDDANMILNNKNDINYEKYYDYALKKINEDKDIVLFD